MKKRILNDKHEQLKYWLGPFNKSMAMFARFEDPPADPPSDPPSDPPAPPSDPPSDPPASILESAGLVKPDGTFVDDWYNSDKLPEDIRGSDALKAMKDFAGLTKSYVNTKKMVGADKIALPGKNAKPEDWQQFFDAVAKANPDYAKPDSPEGYKVEIPEDFKDIFTDERLDHVKKTAHELGLTQKQVDGYIKSELESVAKMLTAQEQEQQRLRDEANLGLKKEWGAAYDERLHVANRLVAEAFGGNKEQQLQFLQKYGDDPTFIRFAANVGAKLVEHKALVAELTQQTPTEALEKIRELETDPRYTSLGSDMTPEERNQHAAKIREQYEIVEAARQRA